MTTGDECQFHVLHHSRLEELAPSLWHVTGILANIAPPREMVVYRLSDSTLLIPGAICLVPQARTSV